MYVTRWTIDLHPEADLFIEFDQVVRELQHQKGYQGLPITVEGKHPRFGKVVAVRTINGGVLVSQRPYIKPVE
jgi:hypothetical protein